MSVAWLLAALALETASEIGYVLSWHAVIDPEDTLAKASGTHRTATRVAWAQLGGGTLGVGLPSGMGAPELTVAPAAVAAAGLVGALVLAHRLQVRADRERSVHAGRSAALGTVSEAVSDVDRFLFHGVRIKSLLGALAFLGFDVLVLWTAFLGVHAHPFPALGIVVMAYIIGAFGGSLPFIAAGVGAVGGIAGMLILYGIHHDSAVAAVVAYQAVGLLVPLIGGALAYLALRRHLDPTALASEPDPVPAGPVEEQAGS